MEICFHLNEIEQAAAQVWDAGKNYAVWALHGDMGAGKTTFVGALCRHLQVSSAVSSPTYAIINEYSGGPVGAVYHMDLYRLKDEEEAAAAGVEDTLYSGKLCLVEWPEKAPALLPPDTLHLYLTLKSADERCIHL